MLHPDVTLLCSAKENDWKNYLSDQFENYVEEKVLVAIESLEELNWPLTPDKKHNFTEAQVVLVVLSQTLLNFLEQNAEKIFEIAKLLKPERTLGFFIDVRPENVNLFHKAALVSYDDWCFIPQEDAEKVVDIVQSLLDKSNKKKSRPRPSFKLVPRKVQEGNGKICLILNQPLEDQQLKVYFNGTSRTEVTVKKLNPYNWQFIVPDSYMRCSSILKVEVCCNEEVIGTQTVKCESRLSQLYSLLSTSCSPAEFMCDAMGVNSYDALDRLLAQIFEKRFPAAEFTGVHMSEDVTYSQAKDEIPTLLHFAARYGLKQLVTVLLRCPGAFSACCTKNIHGMIPAELAMHFKHHDISTVLINYQKLERPVVKNTVTRNTIPTVSVIPNRSPTRGSSFNCEVNNYDIPPSRTIPVPNVDYDYIDEQLPYIAVTNRSTVTEGSRSPTSETAFLESQTKLIEIMEAYKKGASLSEVMKMHDEWKSTCRIPDSEAKSTLEDLRSLYAKAQKNKSKLSKKNSVSLSQLFRIVIGRKHSLDVQDDSSDISNSVNSKKNPDLENHCGRLSSTFSTNSYASTSSSSSSDRLSFASEHSEHDYVTSYRTHSGKNNTYLKSPVYSNNASALNFKQNAMPLPQSDFVHSTCIRTVPAPYDTYDKPANLLNGEEDTSSSALAKVVHLNQSNNEEYDVLPVREPVLVDQSSQLYQNTGINRIERKSNSNAIYPCSPEYDVPKPLSQMWINNPALSFSRASTKNANCRLNSNSNMSFTSVSLNSKNNNESLSIYGNICINEGTARRNSIPDEMAPGPPVLEEEEYYKYVGTPIPVENAK